MTWPGGGPVSDTLSVPHGLGVTPQVGLAGVALGAPSWAHAMTSADNANLNIRLHTTDGSSPALPSNTAVGWLALG